MSNQTVLRWGIMGAGNIAKMFSQALLALDDHRITAVGSRSRERAADFIEQQKIPDAVACGSYEELASREDVDIVYIATIHPQHLACAKVAFAAGKHVLVEKPIAMNADEAREMVDLAKEKELFLMEGMWCRFHPVNQKVKEWIRSGRIGEINMFEANYGFVGDPENDLRLYNLELGGGALLDVGIYPLSMAAFYLDQQPVQLTGYANLDPTSGVDLDMVTMASYADGMLAKTGASVIQKYDNAARIYGSEGMIVVPSFIHPERAEIYDLGEEEDEPWVVETFTASDICNGFEFEAMAVKEAILAGQTTCEDMTGADSVEIMGQVDSLFKEWGITFGK